ncbi:ABC transporter ATP-binding protein [Spiroplasma sabaudiense Ar-1343]|uniref:ABC transporter ATP-binding protein n=1 Tax=Spiroplasma sabaudiense Ar-1343 TaxID=1276257 RepID=W6A9H9_9MOLU|nr:ABC transporter ATP-binding protein [Spiroplasma sabaudiense]AHI53788.1 ABC transporter ATP-binding protein [Spiroplasma sabaudiense Ar-1343]
MLELRNITKKYQDNTGIENVSFDFSKSQIIGLVGSNGAGKTTTIKCIFNLVSYSNGEILLDGEKIQSANLSKLAFFPDSNNIPLKMKVIDYAIYNAVCAGMDLKKAVIEANSIIKTLSLDSICNKNFGELSAGLKKKGILVATLINNPDYIILDEPTANLDIESREELMEIIKLLSQSNKGILITSHIIDELQQYINHLIVINKGKIVYDKDFNNKKDKIIDIYNEFCPTQKKDFSGLIKTNLGETKNNEK